MTFIRVLTVNLTGIVAELVSQTLQQQPDINWLGNVEQWIDIALVIPQTDVLIVGVDDVYTLPESYFHLLGSYPHLKVVLLAAVGDAAIAYWRDLHCQQMQVLSSQTLIDSLRQIHWISTT